MNRRSAIATSLPGFGVAALLSQRNASGAPAPAAPGVYNVRDYHALGDGKTLDTAAIQAATDACAAQGGGLVFFPKGRFLSGTIELKDNVTLYLSPESALVGSPNPRDYKARPFPARDLDVGGYEIWALVYSDGAKNVGIEGKGTIDGNGGPFPPVVHAPDVAGSVRPRAVFLKNCSHVVLRDVVVRESAMWSVHLALCEKVFIHGISVFSSLFVNQDGLVLDSCRDAMVSDCFFNTYDDAVVLKASFPQPCRNISISNCVLTARCAAVKFGTQSLGAFKNVSIANCTCYDCGLGGLKFLTVDGGGLEDVSVSNVTMSNVSAPIFFRLGNRGFDFGVTFEGGGTLEETRRTDIPERANAYPENTMFGVLPAYGIFLRHAKGVTLNNVRLEVQKPDLRPALVADDVEDLEVFGFRAAGSGREPLIRLLETRGALIRGSRPPGAVERFLRVEGQGSRDIALLGNDLRQVRDTASLSGGFGGTVQEAGNLRARAVRSNR
jgi:polygalacturonase